MRQFQNQHFDYRIENVNQNKCSTQGPKWHHVGCLTSGFANVNKHRLPDLLDLPIRYYRQFFLYLASLLTFSTRSSKCEIRTKNVSMKGRSCILGQFQTKILALLNTILISKIFSFLKVNTVVYYWIQYETFYPNYLTQMILSIFFKKVVVK